MPPLCPRFEKAGAVMLKGELFSTDMVRAYLEGRKKHTATPVKDNIELVYGKTQDMVNPNEIAFKVMLKGGRDVLMLPKYQPGDYMYCRETFFCEECASDCAGRTDANECPFNRVGDKCYGYKAQYAGKVPEEIKWTPSIHMPRSAARLFFRVTKVEVMRLEDVTEKFAREDGFPGNLQVGSVIASVSAYQKFIDFWLDTYGPSAHWMWVYWTEPVSKEEALADV